MKILKILIAIILLLFPFGELLRFEIGNNIAIKPLDVAVGITALIWFIYLLSRPISKKIFLARNDIKRPLLFFITVCLLSLLINSTWLQPNEFFISLLYLLRWVSYVVLLFIIVQFDKTFKQKIVWLLFFDGLIILFLGYIQYFFFSSLKGWYHLGWDEHMYRMFSVFLDPNFSGAFFVLYFLFTANLFFTALRKQNKRQQILYGLVLCLTLFAVFFTFSRASLIMLIVSMGVFLFLLQKKKFFLGLIGIMMLFFITISPQFHIENINIFRETSTKARLGNYAVAIHIIADKPLLGVGFNSYRYAKNLYGIQSGWTKFPSHADAGVDNSFLFVLATTGIIGFLAYLWLWKTILGQLFIKRENDQLAIVLIASIVGLSIHALFINSLFFAPLMLWLWISLGITLD